MARRGPSGPRRWHAATRRPCARCRTRVGLALGFWRFVQWRFQVQWQRLRHDAHARGMHIVGDAPIFVAHHSADVWAHADQFLLDEQREPRVVAGVPPDYFSATGQRWGNPLYRWDAMAHDGYRWWKQRMAHLLSQVDVVRLDHFRGFEAYWEIPASEPTAQGGQWCAGPGEAFFDALKDELGPLPIIAEDLGIITDAVTALRRDCGFPGMRVMQFAFGDTARQPLPAAQLRARTVAYTGTHDNDTTVGWWAQASDVERHAARHYLGPMADLEIHWAMIQCTLAVGGPHAGDPVPGRAGPGQPPPHEHARPGRRLLDLAIRLVRCGRRAGQRLAAMVRAHGRLRRHDRPRCH